MLEKIQEMLADALNLSVDKVTPDARIVDDLGAEYIFDTAIGETMSSGFHDLLAYLKSELMWNHSQDVSALVDDFMRVYYKDAYEPMKELLEFTETYFAKLEVESNLCFVPSASQGGEFGAAEVLTKEYLRQQELIIEKALNKIAPLKQTDNALYQKLKNRIDAEKTSYIYWQLMFWKDYFTKEQIAQKIDEFESICNAIGIDLRTVHAAAGTDRPCHGAGRCASGGVPEALSGGHRTGPQLRQTPG